MREKGWIPARWLALWWFLMLLGDLVFYVLLTPIWLGLRARRGSPSSGPARRRAEEASISCLRAQPDEVETAPAASGSGAAARWSRSA